MPLSKEERYARHRLRQSTPEAKEKRRVYDIIRQSTPEYKEHIRLLRLTPKFKENARLSARKFRHTQSYKDWRKKYRSGIEPQKQRRNYEFKRKFGITIDDYVIMFKQQNGVCAICKQKETFTMKGITHSLAVDHNHITGKIRGLLCRSCNQALGHLKDNLDSLRQAIKYLEEYV